MDQKEKIACSASDIYYRILQLGSQRIETGISLNELKEQLQTECLLSDPRNSEHIEQWFDWSFEHKQFGCRCPVRPTDDNCGCNNDDPCGQYDHHNQCRRFLSKQALIDFSQLEQSHKYNQKIELYKNQIGLFQTQIGNQKAQIDTAESTAKSSSRIAKFALFSSIGILLLNSYSSFLKANPLKATLEKTIEEQSQTQKFLKEYLSKSYQLDSTLLQYYLDREESLKKEAEVDKTLKSLNWKLLQIKRKLENN
jgi:hypothetical protein